MRPKDLFTKIREFPHHLGVFATYTIDNDVVEKLKEHTVARTFIMHDSQQGFTAASTYGGRLCLRPARLHKSKGMLAKAKFHPKITLLVNEKKAAIGVGSANLTRDSFQKSGSNYSEKETYAWIEVDRDAEELAHLVQWLERFCVRGWEDIFKQIRVTKTMSANNSAWLFLNNQSEPIGDQILRSIKKKWKFDLTKAACHIVSPFLSRNAREHVVSWLDQVDPRETIVYARKNKNVDVFCDTPALIRFPEQGKKRERFHSKQIMFEWEKERTAVLYLGSANFTKQGFFCPKNRAATLNVGC